MNGRGMVYVCMRMENGLRSTVKGITKQDYHE